jgi:hypothetical protein
MLVFALRAIELLYFKFNLKELVYMAKLGKDKIALFLACASVLGGKTQAMNINKAQSPQTVAAVGGGGLS